MFLDLTESESLGVEYHTCDTYDSQTKVRETWATQPFALCFKKTIQHWIHIAFYYSIALSLISSILCSFTYLLSLEHMQTPLYSFLSKSLPPLPWSFMHLSVQQGFLYYIKIIYLNVSVPRLRSFRAGTIYTHHGSPLPQLLNLN